MSNVHVTVDSVDAERLFDHLIARTSPVGIRSWLRGSMLGFLRQRIAVRFASEGDSAVGPWVELAQATGIIRDAQGYGAFHPINVRTGAMRALLVSSSRITNSRLEIPGSTGGGKMKAKIATAQVGKPGSKSQRATPPRPVLAMNEVDAVFAEHSFEKWLTSGGMG